MSELKIVYLRDWPTNIGNAFIWIGASNSFKTAIPQATINVVGGLGRLLQNRFLNSEKQRVLQFYRRKFYQLSKKGDPWLDEKYMENIELAPNSSFFDFSTGIKTDYVAVTGCILNSAIALFAQSLLMHKRKGAKIVFYAVGGETYSRKEVEVVTHFLERLKPYALISRDSEAFKCYHGIAQHSFNGIDAAFFVGDSFSAPVLELPEYAVLCFDSHKSEPKVATDCRLILRISHSTYPSLAGRKIKNIYSRPNLMISDNPEDYLTLYANAQEVHTDRIHACISTLSLGKKCRLYKKTERNRLFSRLNMSEITNSLIKADLNKLSKEKERQISFLRDILR